MNEDVKRLLTLDDLLRFSSRDELVVRNEMYVEYSGRVYRREIAENVWLLDEGVRRNQEFYSQ